VVPAGIRNSGLTSIAARIILNDINVETLHGLQAVEGIMLKRVEVYKDGKFNEKAMGKLLVHDSPYFRILNFNFKAGQELPIHSHDTDGQLSIAVLEGEGLFLGKDGLTLTAAAGDVLISDISEPHGVRATSDMRVLVTIAPPL